MSMNMDTNLDDSADTGSDITPNLGLALPRADHDLVVDCESIADNFQKLDAKIGEMDKTGFGGMGIIGNPVISQPLDELETAENGSFSINADDCVSTWEHVLTEYQFYQVKVGEFASDFPEIKIIPLWSEVSETELTGRTFENLPFVLPENCDEVYFRMRYGANLPDSDDNAVSFSGWSKPIKIKIIQPEPELEEV